jgi:hypothetical protein
MKTQFDFEKLNTDWLGRACIIGHAGNDEAPYVVIQFSRYKTYQKMEQLYISDKDLERFAVNILKALKSKKLK